MAPQLVLRGVPTVIAMQDTIRDNDAILFATEFYSDLCHERQGGLVEVAVSRARKALLQSGSQINGFGLPVLYLRAQDDRLWDAEQPDEVIESKKEPKQRSVIERWQTWVAFISAIIILLGAITNLPKQLKDAYDTIFENSKKSQFYGKVVDENDNPVIGAEIILPGYRAKGKTDSTGGFDFEVDEEEGIIIQVIVKKNNFEGYSGSETLPGPVTLTFKRRTP